VTEYSGTTFTGADATSVDAYCAAVDAAVKRLLKPYHPERETVTFYCAAPPSEELLTQYYPLASITSIYYRSDGNSVLANFTSDCLIDNTDGDEYTLELDPITGLNGSGVIRRIGRLWGGRYVSPPERLGWKLEPEPGALKITAVVGPASVPKDIEAAAVLAVQLLYESRTSGIPLQSESWNGRSESKAQQYTAEGVLMTPRVWGLLAPYASALKFVV
jgi:hypothetical protein